MEYQEFLCVVEKKMNQRLEGGIRASVHAAVKNNGRIKRGVIVKSPGVNISPAIYMEEFYERFRRGESIEQIVRDVLDFYEAVKYEDPWDTSEVENVDGIKRKIVFKLIHTERNAELLKEVPHIEVLDLSIVFYVLLEVKSEGTATMLIRDEHLKVWGMSKRELFPLACRNVKTMLPAQMIAMREVVDGILDTEAKTPHNLLGNLEKREDDVMYVLTNAIKSFGAACIFYPGMSEKIASYLGESYYVIPSSIHEVILIRESEGLKASDINEMVREVNASQVDEEEQLSNHVYFYEKEKKRMMMR